MMARMLSQLPLPLLPSGAAEIAPGVGFLAGDDGGLVTVHGLATFAWDAGDEAGRRLAAVQLVRLRAASPPAGSPQRPMSPPARTAGAVTRARARRFRCCRTRCPGMASVSWHAGDCLAREPGRCSPPAPAIRWPGC